MEYKTYLLFTSDLRKAKDELKESGGIILIELTDKVLLVNLPNGVEASGYTFSTPKRPPNLDIISNMMVEVWSKRRPKEMRNLLDQLLPRDIPKVTSIQNLDQI